MKKFKDLLVLSDWEKLSYEYDGKLLKTSFKDGEGYDAFIVFPSGVVKNVTLKFRSRTKSYSDAGIIYYATSMMAYIELPDLETGLIHTINFDDKKTANKFKFYLPNPEFKA